MWPPRWVRRRNTKLSILAIGALLGAGGAGCLVGPPWALVGAEAGLLATAFGMFWVLWFTQPDPERLLQVGRAHEASTVLALQVCSSRRLAAKLPSFRDLLAHDLVLMSEALQYLGYQPMALEAAAEAAAIYAGMTAARPGVPGKPTAAYARALLRQAALLAAMSRHGEALAAIEPAVGIYRELAHNEPGAYLPHLADALTRHSDALGYLDRLAEARAAAAEADLIRTDMLPAARP